MGCTCAEVNRKNQKMKLPTQNNLNHQNYQLNKINNMQTPQQKTAINNQYNYFNKGAFNNQIKGNSNLTNQRYIITAGQSNMINKQIMLNGQQLGNSRINNIVNNKVMNKPKKYYNLQIEHVINYYYYLKNTHEILYENEDVLYDNGKSNAKSSDNNKIDNYYENINYSYNNKDNEDNIINDYNLKNNSNSNEREQESNRINEFIIKERDLINEEETIEDIIDYFGFFTFLLIHLPLFFPAILITTSILSCNFNNNYFLIGNSRNNRIPFDEEM